MYCEAPSVRVSHEGMGEHGDWIQGKTRGRHLSIRPALGELHPYYESRMLFSVGKGTTVLRAEDGEVNGS